MKEKDLIKYLNTTFNRSALRKITTNISIPCIEEQEYSYVENYDYNEEDEEKEGAN